MTAERQVHEQQQQQQQKHAGPRAAAAKACLAFISAAWRYCCRHCLLLSAGSGRGISLVGLALWLLILFALVHETCTGSSATLAQGPHAIWFVA